MDECMKALVDIYLRSIEIEDLSSLEMRKNIEDVLYRKEVSIESAIESEDFGQMIGDATINISMNTIKLEKCYFKEIVSPLNSGLGSECIPFNNNIDVLFNKDVDELSNHVQGKGDPMKLIKIYNSARKVKDIAVEGMASYGCKK